MSLILTRSSADVATGDRACCSGPKIAGWTAKEDGERNATGDLRIPCVFRGDSALAGLRTFLCISNASQVLQIQVDHDRENVERGFDVHVVRIE
jgi:hypothetical protein